MTVRRHWLTPVRGNQLYYPEEIDMSFIQFFYNLLWGDLVTIPLPGGSSIGLSLLVLLLIPAGIYFTIRTRFLPFRLFLKC